MPKPGCPCKDCQDRVVGCHGTCEKYKAWSDSNIADLQNRQNQMMIDNYILGMMVTGREKARRKKGKK